MEEVNLLAESLKFMFLGMFVVFAFLSIMVVVVNLQTKLINKFFPEKVSAHPETSDQSDESRRVAAIVAAVSEYCKQS